MKGGVPILLQGHHCGTDLPALPVPEHDVLKRVSCARMRVLSQGFLKFGMS